MTLAGKGVEKLSRLTLRLPETLHQQLTNLAEGEGVSLNQYIVYALTRQVTLAYSVGKVTEEEVQQQKLLFQSLIKDLGKASPSELATVLSERETVPLGKELNSGTVNLLQQRIQDAAVETPPFTFHTCARTCSPVSDISPSISLSHTHNKHRMDENTHND
ncbi:MAG: toxin-antitoxin system HicB family antitoxin, partial [Cyanobacteria bacterium P01_A01_bin.17]